MKVEYILGFGAAAVIVLTIIIVLILYLILQCRGQQRKRRAARRRAAGLCDTSSGGGAGDSYLERSTVDFIVPGIFEKDKRLKKISTPLTGVFGGGLICKKISFKNVNLGFT